LRALAEVSGLMSLVWLGREHRAVAEHRPFRA
jgi:hypothetical protein